MKFLNKISLSLCIAVCSCPAVFAQHRPATSSSAQSKPSQSLGGPITPSQPNFFFNSEQPSVLRLPDEQLQANPAGLRTQPERQPAPIADDPLHPSGGFLKFDLK